MMTRSVGLAMYTVHDVIHREPERVLTALCRMGYRGIEFYGDFDEFDRNVFLPALKDLGMEIWGWHVEWRAWQPDAVNQTMDTLARWGCPVAVVPCLGGRWRVGHTEKEECLDVWKRRVDQMNALQQVCQSNGIRMAYHNHDHEFSLRYNGKTVFEWLFEGLSPSILMEFDTGNCIEGGCDPVAMLERFPEREVLLHMKPYSRTRGFDVILGDVDDANDWTGILRADHGRFRRMLVESEAAPTDELENARRCLDGLRRVETIQRE